VLGELVSTASLAQLRERLAAHQGIEAEQLGIVQREANPRPNPVAIAIENTWTRDGISSHARPFFSYNN